MIDFKLLVSKRGPLFDRRVDQAVTQGLVDARREVATQGVVEVRQQLDQVLKHPTGFYRRHIAERHAGLTEVVHDSGVVYGPWLAGASRRNQATRFKGYAHWRRATQALRQRAGAVAVRLIGERLRRLG
jgi:hypothetical protein